MSDDPLARYAVLDRETGELYDLASFVTELAGREYPVFAIQIPYTPPEPPPDN